MPLAAEDVKNKEFTHSRFKGGYDEREVDDFLDEVEAELNRLNRENADLRARLQVAEQAARQTTSAPPVPHTPSSASTPPQGAPSGAPPQPAGPPAFSPEAARPAVAAPAPAAGQGSQEAALRMLAMAQKTADETVAEARRDADKVLTEARVKAEQLERETHDRHRAVVGSLDSEREKLERRVEELRSFEREYRARLKSYLEGQLRDLEGRGESAPPPSRPTVAPAGGPAGAPGGPAGGPGGPAGGPAMGAPTVPGVQPPARPASPFTPVAAPPVPGAPQPPASEPLGGGDGPSGPPRQAPAGSFEVDEGPEVPPSHD